MILFIKEKNNFVNLVFKNSKFFHLTKNYSIRMFGNLKNVIPQQELYVDTFGA